MRNLSYLYNRLTVDLAPWATVLNEFFFGTATFTTTRDEWIIIADRICNGGKSYYEPVYYQPIVDLPGFTTWTEENLW